MIILGISALYHDSAAAILVDGEVVAAVQEERFTRNKHDNSFPVNAILYCLKEAGIEAQELDYVVFYDNPLLTLDRYLHNVIAERPDCENVIRQSFEPLFSERVWIHEIIRKKLKLGTSDPTKIMTVKHHISHAASAFYPSPYERSVIITMDGVGEWTTLSIGIGEGNHIELKKEIRYPHSLGLFYSAFTYFCGFKVNSGDYKFMGLAPYGIPRYYDLIREKIIDIKEDGSFALNLDYFDFQHGNTMVNEKKMGELFGGNRREPETMITQREMDLAASVQKVTEEIVIKIARYAKNNFGRDTDNLVLAGGVALNCVANGKLKREKIFKNIWIQPAAGDAGGALGAAYYLYYDHLGNKRESDGITDHQKGSYLGPCFSDVEIGKFCASKGYVTHYEPQIAETIARELAQKRVIGLFQGKMEYGPRALGHRSIIADPRDGEMQSNMNLKIKFRESFRPFAPAILKEDLEEYFEMDHDSPYMLFCADVRVERRLDFDIKKEIEASQGNMISVLTKERSDISAVTHVDFSARIQTVDGKYNPEFYEILTEFKRVTGCPVLINTSFNVRGEPIVCTLEDAYICFMRTDMDVLVLGHYILYKQEQPVFSDDKGWRHIFSLD